MQWPRDEINDEVCEYIAYLTGLSPETISERGLPPRTLPCPRGGSIYLGYAFVAHNAEDAGTYVKTSHASSMIIFFWCTVGAAATLFASMLLNALEAM